MAQYDEYIGDDPEQTDDAEIQTIDESVGLEPDSEIIRRSVNQGYAPSMIQYIN